MKRQILSMIAIFLAVSMSIAWAANRTYVNPRFGTTITYPDAIFSQIAPDAINGDGKAWTAVDGATLTVWGQNNVLDFTPTSIADFIAKDIDDVTYRKVGSKWMVVSGFDDSAIVYHRAEFGSAGVIHSMELRYAANVRQHYDRLAGIIAESLIGP
jgi:hypothetical protein